MPNRTPPLVAEIGPRRGFDFGGIVAELIAGLRAHPPGRGELLIECLTRDADPPDLRLSAADVAQLTELNASLAVEIATATSRVSGRKTAVPELELHFSIDGEFDPDEATRQLDIAPDHSHPAPISASTAHRGNAWDLMWGPAEDREFGRLFVALQAALLPRAHKIATFCAERRVRATVEFVVYFATDPPRFFLTPPEIGAVAKLSAGLWYAPYARRADGD